MGSLLLTDLGMLDVFLFLEFFSGDFGFQLADSSSFLTSLTSRFINIAQVALGLGFVIFVHELGHFIAAKTFGVRCDKFYVGFDVPLSIGPIKLPSTLGKFQWGETEYGIGIVPLGGYVKMLGQNDDPREAEQEAERIRASGGEVAELDPRSYPAKPVWQRMIIISAGVIMNLIFAVIMAGVAYQSGVPYTPPVIGNVVAGGPAWVNGIQPGDRVMRYGDMQADEPNMFFSDLQQAIIMEGFESDEPQLALSLLRGKKTLSPNIELTNKLAGRDDVFTMGIAPAQTAVVGRDEPLFWTYLAEQKPNLKNNDRILAVDGVKLPVDEFSGQVLSFELTKQFQKKFDQPVTITIERPNDDPKLKPETLEVELPPVPVNALGLKFPPGPVVAIRKNSVAEKSGLSVGDIIQLVDGQPIDDGFSLPAVIAKHAGQTIELTVSRNGAEEVLSIPVPEYPDFGSIASINGSLPLAGVGATIQIDARVEKIDSQLVGQDSKIQKGDKLEQIEWIPTESTREEMTEFLGRKAAASIFEAKDIGSEFSMANVYKYLQEMPAGAKLRCTFERSGKKVQETLIVNRDASTFFHLRGVSMQRLTKQRVADGFFDAMGLGLYETKRRFMDVLNFLRLLFSGRIGFSGLGGPIEIAQVASAAADEGFGKLLLFLTFLSANLAIVNFLPIPALDGGHMVFLTAEAILGRPINEALQVRLTMVGVLGLLCLMAFVIIKGIVGLF